MSAKTARIGFATALLTGSTVLPLSGCEQPKQKVLDVQTPGVNIEVERSNAGGSIDVETGPEDSGTKLQIDADANDGAEVKVKPKE